MLKFIVYEDGMIFVYDECEHPDFAWRVPTIEELEWIKSAIK